MLLDLVFHCQPFSVVLLLDIWHPFPC
uniref:Uncharacterized protein n=1 Tax=Rhizophora mucronata TaxID=61149 RepID=A0A2P2NCG8_RHIMU